MIKIVAILLISLALIAKQYSLNISKLEEMDILKNLDIDTSFIYDQKYQQMKNNIDQLKRIYFLKALKNGTIFMPNLHELLNQSNIPDTFIYMAMVESKFKAKTKSSRNAAGLWQLMPNIAKKYHLEMDRNIDERLDPIKSTKVAIKYLKYLHKRFKKWYLAAIAYNCGETKLSHAIKKAQTDDLEVLLDENKKYLPKESRNYIRRIIIAALLAHDSNIIEKNNADHLFGSCTNSKLIEVFFNGGISLKSIAQKVGMSLKKIKSCNPQILHSRLPSNKKTYHVYLPQELIANLQSKMQDNKISIGTFIYRVKKNDTISKISKRFNNKISAIKRLNPKLTKILHIGQKIKLIGQYDKRVTNYIKPLDIEKLPLATILNEKNQQTTQKEEQIFTYIVKKGETPTSISLKFNNKISTIEQLNPNFLQNFKTGMILKIKK